MPTPPDTLDRSTLRGGVEPRLRDPCETVQTELRATMVGVRDFLVSLPDRLAPIGIRRECMGDTEIVLAEVLNNIVEHAMRDRDNETIAIRMERRGDILAVQVVDSGHAMPGARLPARKEADIDVAREHLPEGGFGWFLIHELVEELSYVRKGDCNVVRIGLRLG